MSSDKFITLEQLTRTTKGLVNKINAESTVIDGKIGTLSSLTTTAKSSLVAAINEVAANGGGSGGGTTGTISYNDLTDKPTIPVITDTYSSSSSNGMSGIAVNSAITTALGNINSFDVEIVSSTSSVSTPNNHTIYFVPQAVNSSVHDEYMYINNTWELIGTTSVDLSGYLQSSDIAAWAKAANKPTYTASEVGALPDTYTAPVTSVNGATGTPKTSFYVTINGNAASGNTADKTFDQVAAAYEAGYAVYAINGTSILPLSMVRYSEEQISNISFSRAGGNQISTFVWTKNSNNISYANSSMSAYVPTGRTINNKALTSDITLTASDVGALPDTTIIPAAQVQADWNENDNTADDYIQNRTHYEEEISNHTWCENLEFTVATTSSTTINLPDLNTADISYERHFKPGTSYTVTLDNTDYSLTAYEYKNTNTNSIIGVAIGNNSLFPSTSLSPVDGNTYDNTVPFIIYITYSSTAPKYTFRRDSNSIPNNTSHIITIKGYTTATHKIDNKYLKGKLIACGSGNYAEIFNDENNIASGMYSHAEGYNTEAYNNYSHAEGCGTSASGSASHAEGYNSIASNTGSHAEGNANAWTLKFTGDANATTYTISAGTDPCPRLTDIQNLDRIKVAGKTPIAITTDENNRLNSVTFSETRNANNAVNTNEVVYIYTKSSEQGSHAEGMSTLAAGYGSHSGGILSEANGQQAFAHGQGVIANGTNQTVFGKYNITDTTSAFIIGNGTASAFSNAYTLDWNGNGVYAGKLTVGTGPTENMDVATKLYVDTAMNNVPTVPTNVSSFTNDSGYLTLADLPIYDGTVQNG